MKDEQYYSIGKASKICDVSTRMLRYYEEIGLITPDRISEQNGYRYYTIATMRNVQAIRYLAAQGFSLEEIRQALTSDDLDMLQSFFIEKIEETKDTISYYHQRLDSLKGWCSLIIEGTEALRHKVFSPHTNYIPRELYFFYERERPADEQHSEIYIETEYFTKSKSDGHSMIDVGGAFNLYYQSWQERLENTYARQTLLQTMYENSASLENTMQFGGFNAVCAYHIGDMKSVGATYEMLIRWAEEHNFLLRGDCLERHVLDIYSTRDSSMFVTELLLPLDEETNSLELKSSW
ncbi:MAG: MerR family transcriptional regulator [Firmicutes bacterium]|nr:MerR family transcriptional regulator [Bacillota bacterium]